MIKKISEKDKKDWENFIKSKDKIYDKDISYRKGLNKDIHMEIDLHGYSLDGANKKIFEFVNECYDKKVKSINVITGKGLRSKNSDDPYSSTDLGILKYSVPEFIKSNAELMKKIKSINFDESNSKNKGNFFLVVFHPVTEEYNKTCDKKLKCQLRSMNNLCMVIQSIFQYTEYKNINVAFQQWKGQYLDYQNKIMQRKLGIVWIHVFHLFPIIGVEFQRRGLAVVVVHHKMNYREDVRFFCICLLCLYF